MKIIKFGLNFLHEHEKELYESFKNDEIPGKIIESM